MLYVAPSILTRAQKEQAVLPVLQASDNDEQVWKAKIGAARQAVQAVVNGK